MPWLTIKNSSTRICEFPWRDDKNHPQVTCILAGQSAQVGNEMPIEVINGIVAKHQKYGLVEASAAPAEFRGLAYTIDLDAPETPLPAAVNLAAIIARHGLTSHALAGRAYTCSDPSAKLLPLHRVSPGHFVIEAHKIEAILRAVTADDKLPPVEVLGQFTLRDGHHRFAVSQALGAAAIPAVPVT